MSSLGNLLVLGVMKVKLSNSFLENELKSISEEVAYSLAVYGSVTLEVIYNEGTEVHKINIINPFDTDMEDFDAIK